MPHGVGETPAIGARGIRVEAAALRSPSRLQARFLLYPPASHPSRRIRGVRARRRGSPAAAGTSRKRATPWIRPCRREGRRGDRPWRWDENVHGQPIEPHLRCATPGRILRCRLLSPVRALEERHQPGSNGDDMSPISSRRSPCTTNPTCSTTCCRSRRSPTSRC
ncbi:hypothetical protein ACQJBY_005963 [Aegilops geniculata]